MESKTKNNRPRKKTSQVERTFLLENLPEIRQTYLKKIINSQLNIKLRQFIEEELDTELEPPPPNPPQPPPRNASCLDEIATKFGSQENMTTSFSNYVTLSINKTQ